MRLLDTNILSQLDPARGSRDADLIQWMDRNGGSLFLSVMTLTEIENGILKLRRKGASQRAAALSAMLAAVMARFADRILPMDVKVALRVAELNDFAHPLTIELADLIIAATASVHDLTVLTRNLRHFTPLGVKAINPFAGLPERP